jgi:hypothetical protein
MKRVFVDDLMQQGYWYPITAELGANFTPEFQPELTPAEMLHLGVFGGKYMTDCTNEFPLEWFNQAKLCHSHHNPDLNLFKVLAGQSLAIWQRRGWLYEEDPRGWFQWYCRYYMGRRIVHEDARQIKRWIAMKRHKVQIQRHCQRGDMKCRMRQRQALLQWAYDSRLF